MNSNEIDKIKKDTTLELTHDELSIINNSLNEILEMFDNDTEFIIRIGVPKIKVEELLSKINILYKNNKQYFV